MIKSKIILIMICCLIIIPVAIGGCKAGKNATSDDKTDSSVDVEDEKTTYDVVFNAPKYSKMSVGKLKKIFKGLSKPDEWDFENSKGTFHMTNYYLTKNNIYYTFDTYDGKVVRITLTVNKPGTYIDEWKVPDNRENVLKLFKIYKTSEKMKLNDLNVTMRFSKVSKKVKNVDIYDIDTETGKFQTCRFTYDTSYFDLD